MSWFTGEFTELETDSLPMLVVRIDHPMPPGLKISYMDHHWNGYVGVPPGHPLHGVKFSQPCSALAAAWEKAKAGPLGKRGILAVVLGEDQPSPSMVFDVHGSITFSDMITRAPVALDHWWFGFDTMHDDDMDNPKDLAFVEVECRSLAAQIVAIFPT